MLVGRHGFRSDRSRIIEIAAIELWFLHNREAHESDAYSIKF